MGFLWSAGGPKEKVSKLNLKKKRVESGGNFEYKVQRVRKARQKLDFLEYQKVFPHNILDYVRLTALTVFVVDREHQFYVET